MQALQASSQVADIRDPLPVKGPASAEVDTTEHPFMKLLARLRNAMKQGEEPVQGSLENVSEPNLESYSKARPLTSFTAGKTTGMERSDGSIPGSVGQQRTADLAARNGLSKSAGEAVTKIIRGQDEAGLIDETGNSLAFPSSEKAALRAANRGASEAASGAKKGNGPEALVAGTFVNGAKPEDPGSLPSQLANKPGSVTGRNPDNTAEALAKRRMVGSRGNLDSATAAASGTLNGALHPAGAGRPQQAAAAGDKSGLGNTVDEAKNSGRRPSRYSVVDMRLKAAAGSTSQEIPGEGKLESKPGSSNGTDQNRSGIPGTDAAGRQISNDQPSNGFSEASRGLGAEGNDKAPASFAEHLASRLRDGGTLDIVRSAQIVLKDGDAGLIRLRLDPESLGGVKIELKMADKQISARIIVESDLAGEAFRSSLDSLRDAFTSSGFETTSIEVEVRDGRTGTGDTGRGDPQNGGDEESRSLYAARKAEELGDAVPSADAAYGRYGVIDLVV